MFKKDKTVPDYRRCFCTDAGQRVLANMLIEAKFFEYTKTPEEQAVENFLKTVLTKCGTYNIGNVDSYVRDVLNLRVNYGQEDSQED